MRYGLLGLATTASMTLQDQSRLSAHATTYALDDSSTSSSPILPLLFSPVHARSSIDSTKTSPDAPIQQACFANDLTALPTQISELADCSSSLISYFWLSRDYSASTNSPVSDALPHKGSALPRFAQFMHQVLATTQVSASVVVLALLFIDRLRRRVSIRGNPGSEFNIAITALMIANKLSDDHTYSAATWSSVSGIALADLVTAEREFLYGLGFDLNVKLDDFTAWQRLMDGLGHAQKETAQPKRRRPHAQVISPTRPSSRLPSPVAGSSATFRRMSSFPQPLSLHPSQQMHPQVSHSISLPESALSVPATTSRKRSLPDSSDASQGPAKRFASPLRDFNRPEQVFDALPTPQYAPSVAPSPFIPLHNLMQMNHLAQARASPQSFIPPQLCYYSLAAGKRNGIVHHIPPPPRQLGRPHISRHQLLDASQPPRRESYSLSPIEFARRTALSFSGPSSSSQHPNNTFARPMPITQVSPIPAQYLHWSQARLPTTFCNAGQPGVYSPSAPFQYNHSSPLVRATLANWQFPPVVPPNNLLSTQHPAQGSVPTPYYLQPPTQSFPQ